MHRQGLFLLHLKLHYPQRYIRMESIGIVLHILRSRVVREVLIFSASPRALPPSAPIPLSTEIHQNEINWNGVAHTEAKNSEGGVDLQCISKRSCSFCSNFIIHRDTSEWNQLELCCTPEAKSSEGSADFQCIAKRSSPSALILLHTEIHQNGINWNGAAHPEVKSSEGGVDLQCIAKGSSSLCSNFIILIPKSFQIA